ncbi:MAG: type VI secretion protein IcmF/TssM N-terminal domain-containing protein [Candidatus Poribacteria bacterium]
MIWLDLLKKLPAKWLPAVLIVIWGAFWGIGIKLGFHRRPMFIVAIIATIIIVLVWTVIFIVTFVRVKKDTKRLADATAGGKGRIKNLEEKLQFAIKSIRESKVGRDIGKADAQYAVPWYMLLGPTGSGKTSLIMRSGLDFKLRDPSATELTPGPTKDCNWLFANEAIVMDASGRYVNQPDKSIDNAEWLSFLDILQRYRRTKPMDGLIITVDINRIINAKDEDIEKESQNIRDRIDNIVEKLGVSLPVYLIFTKCDLINGFTDFFGSLNANERNQILGFSLNSQQQSNIPTAFKDEWALLCSSLKSYVHKVMTPEIEIQKRRGIYLFPRQLEISFNKVNHFVSTLFRPSTYLDRPMLQGVYLTSSLQEVSPVDLVVSNIEKSYNIKVSTPASAPTESRSFFIRDTLLKAIFSTRGSVTPTSRAMKKNLAKWLVPLAIEIVILGLIVMGIAFSYGKNTELLNKSDTIAKQIAGMGNSPIPQSMVIDLKNQIKELRSFHIFPWRGQRIKVAKALEKRFFVEVPFKVVKDVGAGEKPKSLYNVVIYEQSMPNEFVKTDRDGEAILKAFRGNSVSQIGVKIDYKETGFGIDRAKIETQNSQSEVVLLEPTLILSAGETYRKVSVTFSKLRVLVAQVYDDKRSPVAGVPVTITDPTLGLSLASSFSDDTGAIRLEFRSKDNSMLNVDFGESGISYPSTKQLRIDPGKYDYTMEEMLRTKPPVFDLVIESPSDGTSTKEASIVVKGKVSAAMKNASMEGVAVQIGDQLAFVRAGSFSLDNYQLKDGKNEIGITVVNASTGQPLSQTMVRRVIKAPSAPAGGQQIAQQTIETPQEQTTITSKDVTKVDTTSQITPTPITTSTGITPPKPQVARIEVNPPTIRMKPGEQRTFTAIAYDGSNKPIPNVDISWTVTGDIGQIDNSGNFIARKSGSGQVTVASGNVKSSANITIAEATWKVISTQNKDLKDVSFVDNNTGWAVGRPLLIAKTSDGGVSWQYQVDGNSGKVTFSDGTTFGAEKVSAALWSVHFIDTGSQVMGWAVGEKGIILYSPDGNKWVPQTSFTDDTLYSVYFVDSNRGWAVGREGTILYTTNGGARWTKQPYMDKTTFYGVYFLDPNRGWIVGQNGTILSTTNGGAKWSVQTDPKQKSFLRDVFFTSPTKGWIVGTQGLIMHTTNGGETWMVQTSKTINNLFGVSFINENEGWAVGENGLILKTTDGGKTWNENRVGNQNFLGISATRSGGIWAIGGKGTVASFTF